MAKVVSIKRGLWEDLYIPELIRGMGVTLRHFFINTFTKRDIVTLRYPEETREYPARFRGVHRLMKREDGSVRCVACMMCSTVCPAHCIHIVAGERDDDQGEKFPVSFEIDELTCVVCGLCVEACPTDAIRMDTGIHMPPVYARHEARFNKEDLLKRGARSIAREGGAGHDWAGSYALLGDTRAIYDRKGKLGERLKGG